MMLCDTLFISLVYDMGCSTLRVLFCGKGEKRKSRLNQGKRIAKH
ncbi:hypothetical protein SAMN04487891_105111 [Flagellimonas taeanensis]|uniref:Uncharacterized protein n=1 Tax=Flagellimonas taeanensis TaxID=1005926 RepID=A0A1M6Y468_9FLAO|nr:hypothetical protein SAMN04487891_105111 [Allomuricauda taeanensis]SHL12879.1 hypothetical protein SAMN05216293_2713 [Allomuricauda taeanensis]